LSIIALYDTQPTVIRQADLTVNNNDCLLAVYNDFACTTEFVKKAIDSREKMGDLPLIIQELGLQRIG